MAISRAAFQIRMPGNGEIGARQIAYALKSLEGAAQQSGEAFQNIDGWSEKSHGPGSSNIDAIQEAEESAPEIGAQSFPNLPPADERSAGDQEDIGPTQPQTETRRSVVTGRDAPQVSADSPEREVNGIDTQQLSAQTGIIERRLIGQKNAAAEELTGIHTIVERLLELTEGHLFDGGQKLQSLEQRLAQLEMRYDVNRNSP
jgi:hypothetical protein